MRSGHRANSPQGQGHSRSSEAQRNGPQHPQKRNIASRFWDFVAKKLKERGEWRANLDAKKKSHPNEYVTANATQTISRFTIGLFIIAAIETYWVYQTSHNSTIAQRAFVFQSGDKVYPYSNGETISMVWTNSGETPTRDLLVVTNEFAIVDADVLNDQSIVAYFAKEAGKYYPRFSLIGPKASVEGFPQFIGNDTLTEIRGPMSGKTLLLTGFATYKTVFDNKTHISRYCYLANSPSVGTIVLGACPIGICADDECRREGFP